MQNDKRKISMNKEEKISVKIMYRICPEKYYNRLAEN